MFGRKIAIKTTSKGILNAPLDGGHVKILLYWQPFDEKWYASIYDFDGDPVVIGRKVVTGSFMFSNVFSKLKGDFYVHDETGKEEDPSKDSFRKKTHTIYWVPFR